MDPRQADWDAQRRWSAERERRLAERQAEQERLHEADPYNVPKYLAADDEEFPSEAYTAGWETEEGA